MTADEIRDHIRYSNWASRRLLDAAHKLEPEQQQRNMSVSHKSVLETLSHILFADRIWLLRILGETPQPTGEPFEVEWTRIQKRWEDWAAPLTDAEAASVVYYTNLRGEPSRTPVCQIVLHVVNHATLHRGQVMAMMRQLGVAPPPTDLIFYYRERQQ